MNYQLKYLKYKNKYTNLKKELKGGASKYILFQNYIEDSTVLLTDFKADLDKFSVKSEPSRHLLAIFNKYPSKYKIAANFYSSEEDDLAGCYLIFVVGGSDGLLITLGREYKFPRGFPILWIPKKRIHYFGFYPKFDNDKKRAEDEDLDFVNAISIDFNYKYSGFLAQPIAFEYNDKKYWTVCSKNSPHNSYSIWAADIFRTKMTDKFLDELVTNNIHVCGECMSFCDQEHGTRVLKECIAITMVATGHDVKMIGDEIIVSGSEINFIQHKNQSEMQKFCIDYDLSIDSIFRVSENVEEFMKLLSDNRDHITLGKLTELFCSASSSSFELEVVPGSISHKEVLGECLEGLILKINYSDGKPVKTVKYKFPGYTIRTMFIRDKALKFISVWYSGTFYSIYYNDWVKRWVVKDKGKDYWNFVGSLIVKHYKQLEDEYNKLYPNPIPHELHPEYINADCRVGFHIWLMDKINDMREFVYNPDLDYKKMQSYYKICNDRQGKSLLNTIPTFNVIIILGPIGSGKSSMGNLIENLDKDKFKHIDGDILNLTEEAVLKLGKDRNKRTIELIRDVLFDGKIPIISTGGGALLGSYGKLFLDKYLIDQFKSEKNIKNVELKITVLVSANTDSINFINKEKYFYDDDETYKSSIIEKIQDSYNNYANFFSAIESRKKRELASWLNIKNPKGIFELSKKNFGFAENIIDTLEQNCRLDSLILFPIINPSNREKIFSDIVDSPSLDYFKTLNNVYEKKPEISEPSTEATGIKRNLLYKSIIFDNSKELLKLFYSMIEKETGKSVRELFPNEYNLLNEELHCTTEWVGGKDFFGIESTKKRSVVIEGFVYDVMGLALIINRTDIENQLIRDGFATKPIDSDYHITIVYPDPKTNIKALQKFKKTYGPKYSNIIISNIKKGISGIKIVFEKPIVIEGMDKFIFS